MAPFVPVREARAHLDDRARRSTEPTARRFSVPVQRLNTQHACRPATRPSASRRPRSRPSYWTFRSCAGVDVHDVDHRAVAPLRVRDLAPVRRHDRLDPVDVSAGDRQDRSRWRAVDPDDMHSAIRPAPVSQGTQARSATATETCSTIPSTGSRDWRRPVEAVDRELVASLCVFCDPPRRPSRRRGARPRPGSARSPVGNIGAV